MDVVTIELTQGKMTVVDDEDADLTAWGWCASKGKNKKTFYAVRNGAKLHRVIAARMGISGNVDHEDRDGLNNRRSNLRPASGTQNQANQGLRKDNVSGVKGVSWYKRTGQWFAKIQVNGKQKGLGYFDEIADAAEAVRTAREKAFGAFACHG